MNALFTPLDMTDYESSFVGLDELQGKLSLDLSAVLKATQDSLLPPSHALPANDPIETRPLTARSRSHKDYLEAKKAEEDAGEEEEEEDEEGEEGEEGAEGESEAAEDYGEEVVDPDAWTQDEYLGEPK